MPFWRSFTTHLQTRSIATALEDPPKSFLSCYRARQAHALRFPVVRQLRGGDEQEVIRSSTSGDAVGTDAKDSIREV